MKRFNFIFWCITFCYSVNAQSADCTLDSVPHELTSFNVFTGKNEPKHWQIGQNAWQEKHLLVYADAHFEINGSTINADNSLTVSKLSSVYTPDWTSFVNFPLADPCTDAELFYDAEGNILLSGTSPQGQIEIEGEYFSLSNQNGFLIKFSRTGDFQWFYPLETRARNLTSDTSNNVYFNTELHEDNQQIVKLDSNGQLIWSKSFDEKISDLNTHVWNNTLLTSFSSSDTVQLESTIVYPQTDSSIFSVIARWSLSGNLLEHKKIYTNTNDALMENKQVVVSDLLSGPEGDTSLYVILVRQGQCFIDQTLLDSTTWTRSNALIQFNSSFNFNAYTQLNLPTDANYAIELPQHLSFVTWESYEMYQLNAFERIRQIPFNLPTYELHSSILNESFVTIMVEENRAINVHTFHNADSALPGLLNLSHPLEEEMTFVDDVIDDGHVMYTCTSVFTSNSDCEHGCVHITKFENDEIQWSTSFSHSTARTFLFDPEKRHTYGGSVMEIDGDQLYVGLNHYTLSQADSASLACLNTSSGELVWRKLLPKSVTKDLTISPNHNIAISLRSSNPNEFYIQVYEPNGNLLSDNKLINYASDVIFPSGYDIQLNYLGKDSLLAHFNYQGLSVFPAGDVYIDSIALNTPSNIVYRHTSTMPRFRPNEFTMLLSETEGFKYLKPIASVLSPGSRLVSIHDFVPGSFLYTGQYSDSMFLHDDAIHKRINNPGYFICQNDYNQDSILWFTHIGDSNNLPYDFSIPINREITIDQDYNTYVQMALARPTTLQFDSCSYDVNKPSSMAIVKVDALGSPQSVLLVKSLNEPVGEQYKVPVAISEVHDGCYTFGGYFNGSFQVTGQHVTAQGISGFTARVCSPVITSSYESLKPHSAVSVYPNPVASSQIIRIELPEQTEQLDINLFSHTGKRVLQQTLSGNKVNTIALPSLAAGVYLIEVNTSQYTYVEKVVIR